MNRATPNQNLPIDVDISGAKKLYLVVTNAGDNIDWDHANWITPMLYNDKDSMALTKLKWVKATSGWGTVRVNEAVSGSDLIVNGVKYETGFGVHSNSIVEFDLPEGFTRFKAMAGIDNAAAMQNVGATVNFMLFTQNPSGPLPASRSNITIDLKQLGFRSGCVITDLWSGKKVGEFKNEFSPAINRHGAGLYRIAEKK
jgi:hypothetical protein